MTALRWLLFAGLVVLSVGGMWVVLEYVGEGKDRTPDDVQPTGPLAYLDELEQQRRGHSP